jgi:hypothetical protein
MSKTYSTADLSKLSTKELVELFNKYSDKPVKKFADRATAMKRVAAVLPTKSEPKNVAPKGEKQAETMAANRARKIKILVEGNPKKGTAAERYNLYKNNMTVGKYIELGGQLRDVTWDVKQGWISAE